MGGTVFLTPSLTSDISSAPHAYSKPQVSGLVRLASSHSHQTLQPLHILVRRRLSNIRAPPSVPSGHASPCLLQSLCLGQDLSWE